MKKMGQLFIILTLLLPNRAYAGLIDEGLEAFQQGHFEQAVQHWKAARAQLTYDNQAQYIDIAVLLATAYKNLGLSRQALNILKEAQSRADPINDPVRYANVLSHLGDIYIATGKWQKAETYLNQAETKARETNNPLLLANILNKQGNLWMARRDLKNALKKTLDKYQQHLKRDQTGGGAREPSVGKRLTFTDQELQDIHNEKKQEKYPHCIELNLPIKDRILTDNALQCLATAKAREKYEQSLDKSARSNTLTASVWLNIVQAKIKSGDKKAEAAIQTALKHVKALPDSQEKAFGLINIAQLIRDLQSLPKVPKREKSEQIIPNVNLLFNTRGGISLKEIPLEYKPSVSAQTSHFSPKQIKQFRFQSYQVLTQARQIAQTLQDDRSIAYATGYIAQLYADAKRYDEAIRLTRKAIFYAQHKRPYPELLYQWEWQLGRVFKKQNKIDSAIAAYQRAIEYLQDMRQVQQGYRVLQPFREGEGQAYFELADLLLQKATDAKTKTKKQNWLKAARDNIELLNAAELQNHFQDECIVQLQEKVTDIEKTLPSNTAVFYPILLPDRIELLVSTREGIQQLSVDLMSDEQLRYEARLFRGKLEAASDIKSLLPHAQQLYQWFIKPIGQTLSDYDIDTLVIVPNGILRTIPFAALHNGKRYLVEDYAIAVTPSLKLTDPTQPLQRDQIKALLIGLSKKVSDELDFEALPYIEQELKNIQALIGGDVLLNEDFVIANVETKLKKIPYSIVHFATHGHFDSDPNRTFLLTSEGRLNTNCLRKLVGISEFRDKPVELLTLSACQTAMGDEQAALGLAGVSLQAGARSALASLWSVNDFAMAQVVTAFYRHLKNSALSKAQALQKAQLQFLQRQDSTYSHPHYWAMFLLIGNWL